MSIQSPWGVAVPPFARHPFQVDQREWDYRARMPRERHAEEPFATQGPDSGDYSGGDPLWTPRADTGSLTPSREAMAWQRRADAWAQHSEPDSSQAVEPGNRWSQAVAPGRPAFPADGVSWRTQTAEWRATGARWRQTTEWRSTTGSHGWRSTTEAWQTDGNGEYQPPTETPMAQPALSDAAWKPVDDPLGDPSWSRSNSSEQSSWQQADAGRSTSSTPASETPSWQSSDPSSARSTRATSAPDNRPSWQRDAIDGSATWNDQPDSHSPRAETRPVEQSWSQSAGASWRGDDSVGRRRSESPRDDGRHLVREDDRAAWRRDADFSTDAPPVGRRRAPESSSRSAGGAGWATRTESDNWAGHTDTGNLPAYVDPAAPDSSTWGAHSDPQPPSQYDESAPRRGPLPPERSADSRGRRASYDDSPSPRSRRSYEPPAADRPDDRYTEQAFGSTGYGDPTRDVRRQPQSDSPPGADDRFSSSDRFGAGERFGSDDRVRDEGRFGDGRFGADGRPGSDGRAGADRRTGSVERPGAGRRRAVESPEQYDSPGPSGYSAEPRSPGGRYSNSSTADSDYTDDPRGAGYPSSPRSDAPESGRGPRGSASPARYNDSPSDWREQTGSWEAEPDTSNWSRDPDTGQWSRSNHDPRVEAWRREAARRDGDGVRPRSDGRPADDISASHGAAISDAERGPRQRGDEPRRSRGSEVEPYRGTASGSYGSASVSGQPSAPASGAPGVARGRSSSSSRSGPPSTSRSGPPSSARSGPPGTSAYDDDRYDDTPAPRRRSGNPPGERPYGVASGERPYGDEPPDDRPYGSRAGARANDEDPDRPYGRGGGGAYGSAPSGPYGSARPPVAPRSSVPSWAEAADGPDDSYRQGGRRGEEGQSGRRRRGGPDVDGARRDEPVAWQGDEPAAWQVTERAEAARGSATYRGAGDDDWLRELADRDEPADRAPRRAGGPDAAPFRSRGSAAVPGSANASVSSPSRAGPAREPAARPARGANSFFAPSGSYERRPVLGGLLAGRRGDLLDPDDEEDEQGATSPLAAVGYTLAWYGLPVILIIFYVLAFNSGSHVFTTLGKAAPQFGVSLLLSVLVAVGLRWVSNSWKAVSVGLASAVVGGGLATVLSSAITGNSLS